MDYHIKTCECCHEPIDRNADPWKSAVEWIDGKYVRTYYHMHCHPRMEVRVVLS